MDVQIKVATILLKKADPPLESTRFGLTLDEGCDVTGLIQVLGIPSKLVGSVTVNNRRSHRDKVLVDGDVVAVIPAISGG